MKYQKYTITFVINHILLRAYAKSYAEALKYSKALEVKYKTTTNIIQNF